MSGHGVAFNAPPEEQLPSIRAALDRAIAELPAGANGALVGVATPRGANAAIVARTEHGWQVAAWIGKTWMTPQVDGGVRVMKTW